MDSFRYLIEIIFSFSMFLNGIFFLPQTISLIKTKNTDNLALTTFIGFNFVQIIFILHGIIKHDVLLIIGYIFSLVMSGTTTILIITYRYRKGVNLCQRKKVNH